jgi:ERCC4-type nuclease
MRVVIDEREPALFEKVSALVASKYTSTIPDVSKKVLHLGDISIQETDGTEICIIERKSLSDLLSSIQDSRYEEQSYRLTYSSGLHTHNIIYIIEGEFTTISSVKDKKLILSIITSLSLYKGFSVFRTNSVKETAELIMCLTDKITRNTIKKKTFIYSLATLPQHIIGGEITEKGNIDTIPDVTLTNPSQPPNYCSVVKKVKNKNITPSNFGEIVLSQIPGVGATFAVAIMQTFISLVNLVETLKTDLHCLDNIYVESNGKRKKLSKTVSINVRLFLLGNESI